MARVQQLKRRMVVQSRMEQSMAFYKRACEENRVDYVLLDTKEPFDHALLAFLGKRKGLL